MKIKLLKLVLFKMTILIFEDFLNKYNLRDACMNESDLQRVYFYQIYPRDSKVTTNKRFVDIDNGSMSGSHWTCFYVKDNRSFYLDSFGRTPDKFLLKQLPKPIIYHKNKIQYISSKLCGSYCLYFFVLIERMNYYDVILKRYFG